MNRGRWNCSMALATWIGDRNVNRLVVCRLRSPHSHQRRPAKGRRSSIKWRCMRRQPERTTGPARQNSPTCVTSKEPYGHPRSRAEPYRSRMSVRLLECNAGGRVLPCGSRAVPHFDDDPLSLRRWISNVRTILVPPTRRYPSSPCAPTSPVPVAPTRGRWPRPRQLYLQ